MKRILITGCSGQVGRWVAKLAPADAELICPTRKEFDLSNPDVIAATLKTIAPDQILSCAAYTNVDGAESDQQTAENVNAVSPGIMAEYAASANIPMVHVSTDFVFDGRSTTPYTSSAATNPLSVYGASKLRGDLAVLEHSAWVVRSSWVYSEFSNNFVLTMIKLAASRDELGVVSDQTGSPCYARNLAAMLLRLIEVKPEQKLFHFADSGSISRQEFAIAIIEEAATAGLLPNTIPVNAAKTSDFPAPAERPAYSTLDSSEAEKALGISATPWRQALHEMIYSCRQLSSNS